MLKETVNALGEFGIPDHVAEELMNEAFQMFVRSSEQYCISIFSRYHATKEVAKSNHDYSLNTMLAYQNILQHIPNSKYFMELSDRMENFDGDAMRSRIICQLKEREGQLCFDGIASGGDGRNVLGEKSASL